MSLQNGRLKAVVFDVDGTLYRQGPLRRGMFVRLLRHTATRPADGLRTFRTLQAYRRAQEDLRQHATGDIALAQIRAASERTQTDPASVSACVERWMEQEPLAMLPTCLHAGLVEFLQRCRQHGLRLAALSDYPAAAKLEALGIAHLFEIVLCAQSPDIDVFKPHPRGLQRAMELMGVGANECLYVGDRAEVDAAAAQAAGMACVILTRERTRPAATYTTVTSYPHLQDVLFGSCHAAFRDVLSAES